MSSLIVQDRLKPLKRNNFILDYDFLELGLTIKECQVLFQIEYMNNKYEIIDLPKTKLANIIQIDRSYLYKLLKSLKSKNLILESNEGLYITDEFRKLRAKFYNKNLKNKNTQKQTIIEAKNTLQIQQEKAVLTPKDEAKKISQECGKKPQKVWEKTTPYIYNTNYTHISLIDKSIKEYIYLQSKIAFSKSAVSELTALLNNTFVQGDNSFFKPQIISKETFNLLKESYSNRIKEYMNIKPSQEVNDLLNADSYLNNQIQSIMRKLNLYGMFFVKDAWLKFFERLEALAKLGEYSGNKGEYIYKAITYSNQNNKLWLCLDKEGFRDDEVAKELLRASYLHILQDMGLSIDEIKKSVITPSNEAKNDNNQIHQDNNQSTKQEKDIKIIEITAEQIQTIKEKYKTKINEFVQYRHLKQRYFNNASFNRFLNDLCIFECKKQNVEAIIDQSIDRGYNWVFPLTHQKKRRKADVLIG